MGAQPENLTEPRSIATYLQETYELADEADHAIHELKMRLLTRLYALRAAEDPQIEQRLREAEERFRDGKSFETIITRKELTTLRDLAQ